VCGVYGAVAAESNDFRRDVVARMSAALIHRGPDGDGVAADGRALLGCRRLAIMDVAGGAQPLSDESGRIVAVCNGEIYNHAGLRSRLEASGHHFRTRSDAEVIPHLYEAHGLDFVHELEGMFAIALWDGRADRLILARDRMGEKPLYYAATPHGFLFASEPKALLASGCVERQPDWDGLSVYLATGYVPAPRSAFRDIAKLPPGGRLVVEGETVHVDRWWDVAPLVSTPPLSLGLEAAAQAVRSHLTSAVDAALMTDVPLGVFLSGGLDSSAIAALAHARSDGALATFTLGFDVDGFDEGEHAALVARRLGTRHEKLVITADLFAEGLRDLAPLVDEPLADPALVPTYLLARFARTQVKTVLVGEGGDELFAGYPTYLGGALAGRWRRLPASIRRALTRAAPALGMSRANTTLRYLARRFLEEAELPPAARHRAWTGCFAPARLAALTTPDGPLRVPPPATEVPARTELDALLGFDLVGYLPDDLLAKLDRGCMAASLEGRAPFMDRALVELACRLPIELKMRGVATKRVLRRAVADLVPAPIRRRTKRGLTVPLATWLAGPLQRFARDVLDRLDPRLFRREAVHALLGDHVARRRDNRRELWALIMLQLWRDRAAA
jgi:asparagine synthase (glutamine-hydrolysing)